MDTYIAITLAGCGITLFAAVVAMWRRVPPKDFYSVACLAMCPAFGASLAAHSWFAILPGVLAAFWSVMAWTEPPRRQRRQALAQQIRAMQQQGDTPR